MKRASVYESPGECVECKHSWLESNGWCCLLHAKDLPVNAVRCDYYNRMFSINTGYVVFEDGHGSVLGWSEDESIWVESRILPGTKAYK